MAKTVKGFETDPNGKIREFSHKVSRHQNKSQAQLIPWTPGPRTRLQKIARKVWG